MLQRFTFNHSWKSKERQKRGRPKKLVASVSIAAVAPEVAAIPGPAILPLSHQSQNDTPVSKPAGNLYVGATGIYCINVKFLLLVMNCSQTAERRSCPIESTIARFAERSFNKIRTLLH